MFQWNWNSVAAECTAFIGPAGYGFVQVSPAQESIQGAEWFTSYSPVSYIINNKLGTRDEYAAMVSACHDAGVLVISDTILNHMSGAGFGSLGDGVGSSEFPNFSRWMYASRLDVQSGQVSQSLNTPLSLGLPITSTTATPAPMAPAPTTW